MQWLLNTFTHRLKEEKRARKWDQCAWLLRRNLDQEISAYRTKALCTYWTVKLWEFKNLNAHRWWQEVGIVLPENMEQLDRKRAGENSLLSSRLTVEVVHSRTCILRTCSWYKVEPGTQPDFSMTRHSTQVRRARTKDHQEETEAGSVICSSRILKQHPQSIEEHMTIQMYRNWTVIEWSQWGMRAKEKLLR
jgi:hypothetical protein